MSNQKRKSLVLYHDSYSLISMLSDEEAGKLIKAVFEFDISGILPDDLNDKQKMVFAVIQNYLILNRENYEKKCRTNRRVALEREQKRLIKEHEQTDSQIEKELIAKKINSIQQRLEENERTETYTQTNERERTYTDETYNNTKTKKDIKTDTKIDNNSDTGKGVQGENHKVNTPLHEELHDISVMRYDSQINTQKQIEERRRELLSQIDAMEKEKH